MVAEQNVEGSLPILDALRSFRNLTMLRDVMDIGRGAEKVATSIVGMIQKTGGLSEELQPLARELLTQLVAIDQSAQSAARAEATLAVIQGTATKEQIALLGQSARARDQVVEADRRRSEIGRALAAQAREEERAAAEALRPRLELMEKLNRATSDLAIERQRTALVGVEGGERIIDQLERENALRADGIDLSSNLARSYLGIAAALDRQRDATKDLQGETTEAEAALRSAEREGVSFARGLGGGLLDATRAGEGLLGTITSIGDRLADLITSKLLDIFAQQAGAPLGSFFGSLFGGSTAGAGAGGGFTGAGMSSGQAMTSSGVLHAGGVVGQGGPRRMVDALAFAGAPRMHGGGMVLRPGEVPIIAKRGERVIPAGQAAAPQVVVNVVNETGSKVEHRQRRMPGGVQVHDIIVGEAARGMARGDFDQAMAVRFGLRPGRPA